MDMHFLHMTTGLNVCDEEHAMRDVFLLDVSGNILSHVGFNHWYDLWNLLRFHLLSILFRGSGRRVEAALRSLGEQAKQCELAVVTYHGIAVESSITVYKVPKGYSSAFDLFEIKRLKIEADIYRARRDIMKDSNT